MTVGLRLDEAVWGLLHQALQLYRDNPRATDHLRHQLAQLEQPLRIAIAGPWRSGKSTVLNAIMGEEVAPVDGPDGSGVFTWYEDGPQPRATAYSTNQPPQELAVAKSATGMRVDLVGWRAGELRDIVVQWPTRALRQVTLIDTPAITGPDEQGRSPVMDRVLRDADAVLFLTRDGRGTDLRVLESTRDSAVGQAAPVNVILVLSRVDEAGGGRVDALLTARQLARQQYRDPRVNALCVDLAACSGLIGLAGRVLSESDFAALAQLARVSREDLETHLLSADRFVRGELPVPLDPGVRAALLDRLGLAGVRLATTLVRTGCDSRVKLSAELIRRSGLTELRESMSRFFVDRRDTLKARSALAGVEALVRAEPGPGTGELLSAVEQILAGAHEFRELCLLAALRNARLGFDAELAEEARRLVGGDGVGLAIRLGVEHDATVQRLWEAASDAQWRWRDLAEDPLLRLAQRRGAQVVVRSCEGMLAELAEGGR
ncbi:dynamin family protein [Micromonospora sp. 4G57]|uniref:Dynamin family protein n=1 Tax=Micromonospora sicca TaxID=2202420 RepID=A0ABU5J695_9ACTN|nr:MULTISPECIES: dynamin family protein [unclassified Micromonospora]MDZ5443382.1 dynamin family protein [Micromonospora sp. 4G57]MDZ5488118.1 dynamin family protein [Micromonospora sp. 4G53]